jgi:hypothetical protein
MLCPLKGLGRDKKTFRSVSRRRIHCRVRASRVSRSRLPGGDTIARRSHDARRSRRLNFKRAQLTFIYQNADTQKPVPRSKAVAADAPFLQLALSLSQSDSLITRQPRFIALTYILARRTRARFRAVSETPSLFGAPGEAPQRLPALAPCLRQLFSAAHQSCVN